MRLSSDVLGFTFQATAEFYRGGDIERCRQLTAEILETLRTSHGELHDWTKGGVVVEPPIHKTVEQTAKKGRMNQFFLL